MPIARLHRYIFLMLAFVIAMLVAQLAYTTHRLNRLEAAVERMGEDVGDTMDYVKKAAGVDVLGLDR